MTLPLPPFPTHPLLAPCFNRDYLQHCLPEHRGRYGPMLSQISEDYGCATGLLKLPGSSPMAAFDHCKHILDMPLLVRRARTPPQDVRAKHGLPTVSAPPTQDHGRETHLYINPSMDHSNHRVYIEALLPHLHCFQG